MRFHLKTNSLKILLILVISACSQNNTTGIMEDIKVEEKVEEKVEKEKIEEKKVQEKKILYVKLGDVQIPFFIDPDFTQKEQIRWISNSKEILYTEHGRLIKTENFSKGDLVFSYSNIQDPLKAGLLKTNTSQTWSRLVDWSSSQMGVTLNSTFVYIGKERIRIPKKALSVSSILFHEKVSIPSLNISYTNKFWLNNKTGVVIKSEQYFNPNQRAITLIAGK